MKYVINLKYKFTGIALLGILTFSSCEDLLNQKPHGQFSGNQLSNSDIKGLMAAAYSGLEGHFFGNNESFTAPVSNWVFDVRSDDAYKGGGGVSMEESIHQLEISNITSDNATVVNKWRNNFYAISRVHKAMLAINDLAPSNKESLLAELRLLRGHFYFELVRIFERIPYLDEHTDPTKASSREFTREQIWEKIKLDFNYAWDKLPERQDDAGRFNKYVAAAYMTKAAITTKDWATAITFSDYVINSNRYSLYDNYLDMSKIEFNNQKESIFAIQFSTANNNAHINWGNLLNTTYSEGNLFGNGDDFFLGSQNLVNAFSTDGKGLPYLNSASPVVDENYWGNIDPRLDFTVGRIGMPFRGYTYSMKWCRAYELYGEYSGKKTLIDPNSADMVKGFPWGASSLNFCVIRYADVLLWKAEALIESGVNLEAARSLINDIRGKAKRSINSSYLPKDQNAALASYKVEPYPIEEWDAAFAKKALKMERRLEFAMEGHRWFDLLRWEEAVSVINQYMQSESELRTYYKGASVSQNEIYFPIPKDEVENSGGLYD